MIGPKDRFKHKVEHMDLRRWCTENCQGEFGSTLVKGSVVLNLYSSFTFEREDDAAYFALRWK
jgi:hypothetical protein